MRDPDRRCEVITQEETDLQGKISAIQKACQEAHEQLEVLLQPIREPLGEYARQLKVLQTARFEQETGLKNGDEVYPTPEFMNFQRSNGHWWRDDEPLTIMDTVFEYVLYHNIRVGQGAESVGGIPIVMAMQMRREWLGRHPVEA